MSQAEDSVAIPLASGGVMRVQPVAAHTFRIRLRPDAAFAEPALVRYGILRSEWPAVEFTTGGDEETAFVRAAEAELHVRRSDGWLTLCDASGRPVVESAGAPRSDTESGFGAEFALQEDERLYGLGDVTRERIQKRGDRSQIWVVNVKSYVPIPYVMSTRGWALFVNSTWRHTFDLGCRVPDRLCFWGKRGELDFYLILGDSAPQLLDRYTDIVGKPALLPLWAYGLTFVCNQQANAREMLDDCLNFRREGIPCDVIGLEPGWMEKHYDFSVEKKWHPERFFIPSWSPKGPHTFLSAAGRLGFKMSLWLCCDYDLSYEEERQLQAKSAVQAEAESRAPDADDFEQDEHFAHGRTLMDRMTRPEEPWFEHLKKFVGQGVSAFKMDGALMVNEHPDRKWGNGMDDEEMHNLYPVLLNKQMSRGFAEHTGRRPMVYSSGGYAGIQQFSATWAGDTGGGPKPLVSMLNHGLSGHVNTSCDMDVFTPAGIHFGFLQPWSQLCSWAYWRHPWFLGKDLLPIFKWYARLRYRLIPYIYSMAHVAARTGMPIMRAMPLVYPDHPGVDELLQQYLFGDAFLVAAFTNRVSLPAGKWIDFWTGEGHEGPKEMECQVPADRGGPLFIRAGSIIPNWPEMQYVGEQPVDTLSLHVYPHGESEFTLYEDDGVSFGYREGQVAQTRITCRASRDQVELEIAPRVGAYEGMPDERCFDVWLYTESAPASAWINGSAAEWCYDEDARAVRLRVAEDPDRRRPALVRCVW
ncbi:MAG: DUF5110 domain-containing protein [Armatimonadetes bacterium]|nr:DUF5110 domain-containing protein [Armatimonadota bacterium]